MEASRLPQAMSSGNRNSCPASHMSSRDRVDYVHASGCFERAREPSLVENLSSRRVPEGDHDIAFVKLVTLGATIIVAQV